MAWVGLLSGLSIYFACLVCHNTAKPHPLIRQFSPMLEQSRQRRLFFVINTTMHMDAEYVLLISASLLVRLLTGIHGYSGQNNPPNFGDYEAQRHWMEITVNTPIKEWYVETSDNQLSYWGLDYPPVTAYQSWGYGKVMELVDPSMVALNSSRGYETSFSKRMMRNSVIVSDILVLFPLVIWALYNITKKQSLELRSWSLFAVLFQPLFILIDHGHFQYNGLSLGLTCGAVAALFEEREILGSVLFCLALNHKQMTMYFAPAFFAHLLGRQLRKKTMLQKFLGLAKLGVTVVTTFAICWAPFLTPSSLLFQVLNRLVPIKRGLFEDYVANFWCATSRIIKWKQIFSQEALLKICGGLTLLGLLPSCIKQGFQPSKMGFLYCLANSAWSFFLFSYQVHEKSVMLPLLPLSLLALEEPFLVALLGPICALSCFPLLIRDGVGIAYLGLIVIWISGVAFFWKHIITPKTSKFEIQGIDVKALIMIGSVSGGAILHLMQMFIPPPQRFWFLYPMLMTTYSFGHFFIAAAYTNWKHFAIQSSELQITAKSKKRK